MNLILCLFVRCFMCMYVKYVRAKGLLNIDNKIIGVGKHNKRWKDKLKRLQKNVYKLIKTKTQTNCCKIALKLTLI